MTKTVKASASSISIPGRIGPFRPHVDRAAVDLRTGARGKTPDGRGER